MVRRKPKGKVYVEHFDPSELEGSIDNAIKFLLTLKDKSKYKDLELQYDGGCEGEYGYLPCFDVFGIEPE